MQPIIEAYSARLDVSAPLSKDVSVCGLYVLRWMVDRAHYERELTLIVSWIIRHTTSRQDAWMQVFCIRDVAQYIVDYPRASMFALCFFFIIELYAQEQARSETKGFLLTMAKNFVRTVQYVPHGDHVMKPMLRNAIEYMVVSVANMFEEDEYTTG
jgi:hypothetical protein